MVSFTGPSQRPFARIAPFKDQVCGQIRLLSRASDHHLGNERFSPQAIALAAGVGLIKMETIPGATPVHFDLSDETGEALASQIVQKYAVKRVSRESAYVVVTDRVSRALQAVAHGHYVIAIANNERLYEELRLISRVPQYSGFIRVFERDCCLVEMQRDLVYFSHVPPRTFSGPHEDVIPPASGSLLAEISGLRILVVANYGGRLARYQLRGAGQLVVSDSYIDVVGLHDLAFDIVLVDLFMSNEGPIDGRLTLRAKLFSDVCVGAFLPYYIPMNTGASIVVIDDKRSSSETSFMAGGRLSGIHELSGNVVSFFSAEHGSERRWIEIVEHAIEARKQLDLLRRRNHC
jgi:hypothetical protein